MDNTTTPATPTTLHEEDPEIFLNCMEAALIALQDKRMFDTIMDEMDLVDEEGRQMVDKLEEWLKAGGRG